MKRFLPNIISKSDEFFIRCLKILCKRTIIALYYYKAIIVLLLVSLHAIIERCNLLMKLIPHPHQSNHSPAGGSFVAPSPHATSSRSTLVCPLAPTDGDLISAAGRKLRRAGKKRAPRCEPRWWGQFTAMSRAGRPSRAPLALSRTGRRHLLHKGENRTQKRVVSPFWR